MKKLKTATLLIAASAVLSSAPAYAKDDQKVYVPEKGKTSSPVGRPKQPSKSFVYVTIDSDIDELSFEFSEDIQTLMWFSLPKAQERFRQEWSTMPIRR